MQYYCYKLIYARADYDYLYQTYNRPLSTWKDTHYVNKYSHMVINKNVAWC